MYSSFFTDVEPSSLKHEGIHFVMDDKQEQNALQRVDRDVTYGSLKSH